MAGSPSRASNCGSADGVVDQLGQRTQPVDDGRAHVPLARVDDQRGQPVFPGRAAGRDQPAERPPDQDDALRIDLGLRRDRVEHGRHHVLPVRPHRDALVVQHRSLAGAVQGGEHVTAIERGRDRGVQLFGGAVVAADVQDRRPRSARSARPTRCGRGEEVARYRPGEDAAGVVQVVEGGPERADAGGVGAAQLGPVQVVAVEEEGLPEVLGRPQVGAPGADRVPGLGRVVGLADQPGREIRPGPVPAVPVARRDLPGDGQAFPDVGHPRVGLAHAALQLPVEVDVVEVELHSSPRHPAFP